MTALATRSEAQLLEEAFLGGLEDMQNAYERIVETEAWLSLGFDSFAGWWQQRVMPTMRALSMRPTREIAAAVVEKVREEEADLPPAQRRTQRELADMVGMDRSSLANRDGSRSAPRAESRQPDLETEPVAMPARQDVADTITAALDERAQQAAEIQRAHQGLRDNLNAIPPERIAEIEESVRPQVQFGHLVSVCRDFVERLSTVDMAYAARGIDHSRTSPIQQAVERLKLLRQTLGEIA